MEPLTLVSEPKPFLDILLICVTGCLVYGFRVCFDFFGCNGASMTDKKPTDPGLLADLARTVCVRRLR